MNSTSKETKDSFCYKLTNDKSCRLVSWQFSIFGKKKNVKTKRIEVFQH